MPASDYRRPLKALVFMLALLPLFVMGVGVVQNNLGPDPAEALAHMSGEWGLRFLLITLVITPLRLLTSTGEWLHYRRMLGLFAFFYAFVHLLVYCVFLLELQWQDLWADILERPYITVGFAALVLLVPLAITSTRGWQLRLGRNWQRLHKLIYLAMTLVLLHLLWQARSDLGEPLFYTVLFLVLMVLRLSVVQRKMKQWRGNKAR